jgi:outer membrane protein assembly factor BamB
LAGDVLWSGNLLFAEGEPRVALGDGILFAAAGEWLYGFDGEGTSLWTAQDVPEALGLAIGRSGKLVTHRYDDDRGIGYVAERDASGGVVWELPFLTGADNRRITDMAIDPCDDSIVFVGAQGTLVWVQKLDANGEEQWSTTLDLVPDVNDTALAVTIAGDATIVVAGRRGETLESDLFVAAFSG